MSLHIEPLAPRVAQRKIDLEKTKADGAAQINQRMKRTVNRRSGPPAHPARAAGRRDRSRARPVPLHRLPVRHRGGPRRPARRRRGRRGRRQQGPHRAAPDVGRPGRRVLRPPRCPWARACPRRAWAGAPDHRGAVRPAPGSRTAPSTPPGPLPRTLLPEDSPMLGRDRDTSAALASRSLGQLLHDEGAAAIFAPAPKVAPPPAPPAAPRRSTPRHGLPGRLAGRSPVLLRDRAFRATTNQFAGINPFVNSADLPQLGPILGRNVTTRGAFAYSAAALVTDAQIIENPNIIILGKPGSGKSGLIKKLCVSSMAYGTSVLGRRGHQERVHRAVPRPGRAPRRAGPRHRQPAQPPDLGVAGTQPADRPRRAAGRPGRHPVPPPHPAASAAGDAARTVHHGP